MRCIFCNAEVEVGKTCAYCGSVAEPQYYKMEPRQRVNKQQAPEPLENGTYTVKKGDCLWNIAKRYLGSGLEAYKIAKINGIKNPDRIYPGQVLKITEG